MPDISFVETCRKAAAMLTADRIEVARLKDDLLTARHALNTALAQVSLLRNRLLPAQARDDPP